ncbi:histidine kinase [Leifsonia sp. NPDC080035]|uniref:histidine kinase n=1 Tax=Leifsonia sp. NPDC080035 TaxID=3143936 RepID=A0AAU7GCT3_9MICO
MSSLLHRSRWLFEPAVAIVFFVFWAVAEVGRHQLGPGLVRSVVPFWAALLLLAVAIGLSRIQPVVAMSAATAVLIGQLLFPTAIFDEPLVYVGLGIVALVVASCLRGRMLVVSFAFAVGAGVSTAGLLAWWVGIGRGDMGSRAMFFVLCAAASAGAWLIGALIGAWTRNRDAQLELARTTAELQEATTEAIVAGERERIAQDVHDIMAHSLSVILAQADGARALADARPQQMSASLVSIADAARSSLTEVRMLIEGLVSDPDGAETPSLADVDALVERMRAAGLAVTVERFAEPAGLTATQELAVYRIVQEALTNALKHGASPTAARVALDARGGGLTISVSSPAASSPTAEQRGGRGVHGMRERARLAGGWLDAGPDEAEGGYLVTAYIPAAEAVVA